MMELKRFNWVKKYDFEKMAGIVGLLRNVLEGYAKGTLPASDFSDPELETLLESLLKNQRQEEGLEGSWAVCPSREDLPEDEEMDFIQFPTCEAAGLLSWVAQKKPETAARLEGFEEALARGLNFLSLIGLEGYGADGSLQTLEALLLLCTGQVPRYLRENPQAAPALTDLLEEKRREIQDRVDRGDTKMAWGQEMGPLYQVLLKALG